ncbi:4-hydroxybutyryl-CoA dehydratase / vinylacetyl-CoA-Delta-isomerase [Desulfofundulus australicus DSM 11792]|uniref:4-hydroxybutyryl-CoA dehydratase / vinylacetyl-CoA-Delta-isomerase n=1 Tax=Desulfofundulus australicus DSM 11792 TaxID=1121425 RepID=A0A1M5AK23_9FIRM|nr:4-hydroxyphenylacetate 3-hydroxylase N-terminal domain-containing protein [Desulfofundulus australicus]SHF30599.1 4-hydroxybutyryl-CoA dehydratase / vinylacetyl-CoA-Delta-isomerase [Desulfofundulus australicus DSM 11792]
MRTAEQYRAKLRSMRKNVYIDGKLVERDDPQLIPGQNVVAETFNFAADPKYADLMTARSHITGKVINRFTHIHQNVDDLLKKQEMTRLLCQYVGGCIQRCMGVDALNALSVVTRDCDLAMGTNYHERFLKYLEYYQENDLVGNCAQTDVKGDRMKRPHEQVDPDLYVRVVEKRADGIIVRGAKAHNTIAPYADEIIVIPTRFMTEKDADWAVAFAVPADAEGVYLICRATAPRPRKELKAPFAEYGSADSLTVFDNVFVPWERVFLCGETKFAGQLALQFANFHRHSYTGCKPAVTDIIMGAAALVAEYNGIEKASHVRDKLAQLVAVAELVYGTGIAAAVKAHQAASGTYVPNFVYTNVARYHAGINIYHEHEILADLAGGLPATLPPEGDFLNPVTRDFLHKYIMRNPAISAENQHRCFRLCSDLLCSAHTGVRQVGGIHGGGSPIMEKIAIMGMYDMEAKKKIAKRLAGIKD